MFIWIHTGSEFTSGTFTSNTWSASANNTRVSASNTSFYDSTSRTLNITGVQLEVGAVATNFEHRSYGEELALCQRYYYHSGTLNAGQNGQAVSGGYSTYFGASWTFPTTMRTTPTILQNINITTNSTGTQSAGVTPTMYRFNHGNMSGNYSYWTGSFIVEAEL